MHYKFKCSSILIFACCLLTGASIQAKTDESFWAGKLGALHLPTDNLESGLLPSYPSMYQYNDNNTGISYFQFFNTKSYGTQGRPFSYSIVEGVLVNTDFELNLSFPAINSSSFLENAEEWWGADVAQAIAEIADGRLCFNPHIQWQVKSGISEERWEVISDDASRSIVSVQETFTAILPVPEAIATCSNWSFGSNLTHTDVREPVLNEFTYNKNPFLSVDASSFDGEWSIPHWYVAPVGEDANDDFAYNSLWQDRFMFVSGSNTVAAEISGLTFTWSFADGVLTLENDVRTYEYSARERRGEFFTVTVKTFENGELVDVSSSEMAKFSEQAPGETELLSFLQQDYPFVMGATATKSESVNFINGTLTCPNNYFGFAFLPDGRVAPRSFCWDYINASTGINEGIYYSLTSQQSETFSYDEATGLLEVYEQFSTLINTRQWRVVEIIDDRDILVFESYLKNRDDDGDGEYEDSENYYFLKPRLQVYRKMDLSQNVEAWTNTDSDDDGLNNAEETELGTSIIDADTDGDGVSDGMEVANGTNPLGDGPVVNTRVAYDYDGDGKADVAVRRPSTSLQYILNSSDSDIQRVTFGLQDGDIPVSGDFDGDGIADVAVRRPSNYTWYILNSSDGEIQRIELGKDVNDIPVPADYDGDGITDVAVRRPSSQMWYILNSSDGEIQRIKFGLQEADIPVPADYDGDGIADVAVRRPSTQLWYIQNSSDGEIQRVKFGLQEADIPVPADYDGDGKADIAVRRPSTQYWYILNSSDDEIQRVKFGLQEADIPVVADYDGDGKADVAVRRPSTQLQYIKRSSDDMIERITFGRREADIPLAAPVTIKMQMLQAVAENADQTTADETESMKVEVVAAED